MVGEGGVEVVRWEDDGEVVVWRNWVASRSNRWKVCTHIDIFAHYGSHIEEPRLDLCS